ncbi:hypothetical protein GO009_17275 [Muricauda sp. TY007]|uniref:hypothetical protein n=1 Tax=Allomuricauda sp. TY007 TaxID=2683200 RepID=UPI0013BFFE6C|nr:hypothetical protein [Muricauda sp. TY007]NDV17766.1 hypothetical protein [Muricauda sp. TY007]
MLPKKELNIYPKNEENIRAILEFYFGKYDFPEDNATEYLMSFTSLTLNQTEFIARKLSESWESVFKEFLHEKTTIQNLMKYGIDGFTKSANEISPKPKNPRRIKTLEFMEFVKSTEIDFEYLEKNN